MLWRGGRVGRWQLGCPYSCAKALHPQQGTFALVFALIFFPLGFDNLGNYKAQEKVR